MTVIGAVGVGPGTFLAIVAASAIAGVIAATVKISGIGIPVVVIELVFGVLLGPQVLGLKITPSVTFFADLGLGMLFFFAGLEVDFERIKGSPLRLACLGWAMSLAIAYTIGGVLAAAGIVLSLLYTGSALATTAIGTLIPILSDTGELRTKMGTYLLAAGAAGEFGPVLLLTLALSAEGTVHNAVILIAFIAVAVAVAVLTTRSAARTLPVFQRTLNHSSQLAVRWTVVLVFAMAFLAFKLGLDLLLGGFAAGLITRQVIGDEELPSFDAKLAAVGFGVFIPFFFVVSGMKLDVDAVFSTPSGVPKLVLFFFLFLVVRGTPALLLYRHELDPRARMSLAFFSSTQLPLVLAITELARDTGHMRASTAASLVCAAALSTLVFPIVGLKLRPVTPDIHLEPPLATELLLEPPRPGEAVT